ncbi:MAG: HD domain-containing protein [Dehalococcoidia bacterium]
MNASLNPHTGLGVEPGGLPYPFYADQGALFLRDGDADAMTPAAPALALLVAGAGGLHVGLETAARIEAAAGAVGQLTSRERGRLLAEFMLAGNVAETVDRAVRTRVFRQLLPDLDQLREMPRGDGRYKNVYTHTLQVLGATPPDLITRLAALLHDIAKPESLVIEGGAVHFPNHDLLGAERASRRLRALKFDEDVVDAVATLVRLHLRANSYEPDWTDSAVRRLHLDAGAHWERLLDLSYADVTSARHEAVARARRRVEALAEHARGLDTPVEVSPLDGTALMERFGRGPGRWIGEVKRRLLELVRDGLLAQDDEDAAWSAAATFLAETEDSDAW